MPLIHKCLGLLLFFGGWQLLTDLNVIDSFMLPAPLSVAAAFWEIAKDGTLWVNLSASLQRVLVGYLIACAVGVATGLLCGCWNVASDVVRPVVEMLRPIPPLAWIPVTILWFGIGNEASYFLVFLGAVFPCFLATYAAIRGLDRNQINAALCLGASRRLLLMDVMIPASLPIILPGLRIALGVAWMCVVTAELIAAQNGLGYFIQQSRMLFQIQNVIAGMAAIGIIGFGMSALLELVERRVNAWAPSERAS